MGTLHGGCSVPDANINQGSLRWLWLAFAIVVIDQGSKILAEYLLVIHEPVAVLPSFNLYLTYNLGAAFSFLSQAGGWQRWLFALLSTGISVFIVLWLRRIPRDETSLACALALVLGGAIGNLIDRLFRARGGVVDFIDIYYGSWHWPAFNAADSAISIGAVILLWSAIRGTENND
jgi:signal peptidase II